MQLTVKLTVKPNGEIEDAETNRARSTALDEGVERCIHEAAVGVRLRPGGLSASTVTATWELHPPKAPFALAFYRGLLQDERSLC